MSHKRKVVHVVPSALRLQSQRLSRIPAALPDRILGLTEEFEKDHDTRKVNLTVGMYRNDKGQMERFHSISQAQRIISHGNGLADNLAYLPISGSLDYRSSVLDFLFKESAAPKGQSYLEENKVSFAQTLSGTGALALASKFLTSFISSTVWIPTPTWANHLNIFQQNGFDDVRYYSYYENGVLDVAGWLRQLKEAALGENHPQCILLHACCHNPTGVDPTRSQWHEILDVINELEMIPIIDMAYQGLESGNLSEDAYLLRMCLEYEWRNGLYVCQSFAKNMGLYGERVGALAIVHPLNSLDSTARVDSQLKRIIRGTYSSPPAYGARVASLVLSSPDLKVQWYRDVQQMCDRLWSVRCMLHDRLGWSNLIDRERQHGMFYYSGLSTRQVQLLKESRSVYLTQDGRMSLAGINSANVDYVADALRHVSRL